jgi:hypothetical protein
MKFSVKDNQSYVHWINSGHTLLQPVVLVIKEIINHHPSAIFPAEIEKDKGYPYPVPTQPQTCFLCSLYSLWAGLKNPTATVPNRAKIW